MLLTAEAVRRVTRNPEDALQAFENHIVVGDCLDVLPHLPTGCVDLIHTSPPYNIAKPYWGASDDRTLQAAYEEFLASVIRECKRVLKPNGSIFWHTGYTQPENGVPGDIAPIDMLCHDFFKDEPDSMVLWDRIIWYYFGGMAFKRKFTNRHQTILWYVKPDGGLANPRFDVDQIREKSREYDKRNNLWGRNPGNVWEADRVAFGSIGQSSHIAVFPEEVTEKIVRACSVPGDLVLDPFLGSGTVAKVAHSLGRRWLGIEISEDYSVEAARRIGYAQPSEYHALISGLVKRQVFGNAHKTLPVAEAEQRLRIFFKGNHLDQVAAEFQQTVERAIQDRTRPRAEKRNAWIEFDERIQGLRNGDPVVLADRILLDGYKNRRNVNGISRYKSALDVLVPLITNVRDPAFDLGKLIREVASQEPSSFKIEGDLITLEDTKRRLRPVEPGIEQNNAHTGTHSV
ncbi:MAG: site-specific DNA-methyltransferase [Dehalococcoidia bacterium]